MSKINTIEKEPTYFFLYDTEFLGVKPPMHFFAFCLGPALVYLLCVFYIFPLFSPTTKSGIAFCSRLRYWHNIVMFLFSLACFVVSFKDMFDRNELGFISLKLPDMMPMLCDDISENLTFWYKIFLLSKIYEWIDTAFIVWLKNDYARELLKEIKDDKLRLTATNGGAAVARATVSAADAAKKSSKQSAELSFLHLYHHASTFWLYLSMLNLPGMARMGILLNSFVHTLMYLHYAHPLPMPFFITMSQIVQLAFGTWVWYLGFQNCPAHKNFISNHFLDYLSPWTQAPIYLLAFIRFFFKRFIFGTEGKNKNKKEKTQ